MIEFTCPGCLARCIANEAFCGMRARCVVCGAFIRIPITTGEVAFPLGPLPAGPLPSRPSKLTTATKPPKPSVSPQSESGLIVLGEDDNELIPKAPTQEPSEDATPVPASKDSSGESQPITSQPKAKATKPSTNRSEAPEQPQRVWTDLEDTAEAVAAGEKAQRESEGEPTDAAPSKQKRLLVIGGACVLISIVLACVIVFTRDESPRPLPSAGPRIEPELEPQPPPSKKVESKKEEPKKAPPAAIAEVAPPPRSAGDVVRVVAAQMIAERLANPAAYDAATRGKLFLIRGTFARTRNGMLFLAEGTDDESGIACAFSRLGGKNRAVETPPEIDFLQPGQAVIVRGWYAGNLQFLNCNVVATTGPADEDYRQKEIELVGVVGKSRYDPEDAERFPSITLEPPTTDCPVSVRCLFRVTDRERLSKLQSGQTVTVRGRCDGRSFRVVRLHNCSLVPNEDPPSPGIPRVRAERFFAAYEVDLLPFERPNSLVPPLPVSAEQLASAFDGDVSEANATYRYKAVEVRGKVIERRASRMVVLETGTSHKYQVLAAFTPSRYAAVKDYPELIIRGVCVGVSGKFVRIENADAIDADAGNATVRTTAEFLPLKPGSELTYDILNSPGQRESTLTRVSLGVFEPDIVRMTPLRAGTYPKATLFSDPPGQPRWTRDLSKQKTGIQTMQYRVIEDVVEVRDKPSPPAQPSSWWDPIFKLGLRKGERWSTTMPDGRTVTYTVANFGADATKRQTVEIARVVKNPKDAGTWEEATITYARGIGETRRVITRQYASGKAYTLLEMKLVEPAAPGVLDGKNELDPFKDMKKGD